MLFAERSRNSAPDCIHIATEGPLGWLARRYCLKNKFNFTTSFHSIEALACGTPVAAFPVEVGALDPDLKSAIHKALLCKSEDCIAYAGKYFWSTVAEIFESYLEPAISSKCVARLTPEIGLNAG